MTISELSRAISSHWLVFVYAVMQLAEICSDAYVLEIHSMLFERPGHLMLEQAAKIIYSPQTHRDITHKVAACPDTSAIVQQYAMSLSKRFVSSPPKPKRTCDIQVIKDTGTRRPNVMPGLHWPEHI